MNLWEYWQAPLQSLDILFLQLSQSLEESGQQSRCPGAARQRLGHAAAELSCFPRVSLAALSFLIDPESTVAQEELVED